MTAVTAQHRMLPWHEAGATQPQQLCQLWLFPSLSNGTGSGSEQPLPLSGMCGRNHTPTEGQPPLPQQPDAARGGTPWLGLWSHRIFQRYTASLPTSLSCIQSVDQRRLAGETGCGNSVRGQGTRDHNVHAGSSVGPVSTGCPHVRLMITPRSPGNK